MKKYIWEGIMTGFAVVLGIKPVLVTIGVLISIDLILGLYAAIKQGEKIESKKLANTVSKGIVYHLFIISAFIIEKFIFNGHIPMLEITAGFISLIELKSISENVDKIIGLNLFDMLRKIFLRTQKIVDKDVANDISATFDEEFEKKKKKENE